MADILVSVAGGASKRLRDMDDGSHAEVVHIGSLAKLGYQQITTLSTVQFLSVPTGATKALIQAETQSVRWRDDANPSASVGMLLAAGATLEYSSDLASIRFIEVTASAKLNISYYG